MFVVEVLGGEGRLSHFLHAQHHQKKLFRSHNDNNAADGDNCGSSYVIKPCEETCWVCQRPKDMVSLSLLPQSYGAHRFGDNGALKDAHLQALEKPICWECAH